MDSKIPVQDLTLDVEQIKRLLPHRAPFLFVEKLCEIRAGESAVGYKAVSYNEPYFQGHFPEFAVMPGVLIVEAMAQTAGALVVHTYGLSSENRVVYFMTIDKARFRRPVKPGELLPIPVRALRRRGPVWKFSGEAWVDGELCAEAVFGAMIHDFVPPAGDESSSDSAR
jgi:3-hydroxyacyl-[acyl-carrier-protein] dehydratase